MKFLTATLTLASLALHVGAQGALRQFQEEYNKNIVKKAITEFVAGGNPSGYEYYSENFVQHNPDLPDGREFLLDQFATNRPEGLTYEAGGYWAEGDYVVVHGRIAGIGPTAVITCDLFKVLDGKIVEHWDIIQPETPAADTASGLPMWPATLEDVQPRSAEVEALNRRIVISATNRLFGQSDVEVLNEFWAGENYIQHNPQVPNGTDFLVGAISATSPGDWTYEIGAAIAHGDWVILYNRYSGPMNSLGADIFRLEDGIIVEHWDILQAERPPTNTTSGNRMFPPTN